MLCSGRTLGKLRRVTTDQSKYNEDGLGEVGAAFGDNVNRIPYEGTKRTRTKPGPDQTHPTNSFVHPPERNWKNLLPTSTRIKSRLLLFSSQNNWQPIKFVSLLVFWVDQLNLISSRFETPMEMADLCSGLNFIVVDGWLISEVSAGWGSHLIIPVSREYTI